MFTIGLCYAWYMGLPTALGSNGGLNAFSSLTLLEKKFKTRKSERLFNIFILTMT